MTVSGGGQGEKVGRGGGGGEEGGGSGGGKRSDNGRLLAKLPTMAWRLADVEIFSTLSSALPDDPLSSSTCHSLERAERGFLGSRHLAVDVHAPHVLPRGEAEHRHLADARTRLCSEGELIQLCDTLTYGAEQSAKQTLLIVRATTNSNSGEHPACLNLRRK